MGKKVSPCIVIMLAALPLVLLVGCQPQPEPTSPPPITPTPAPAPTPTPPAFTVSVSPLSKTVASSEMAIYTLTVTSINDFSQPVRLSISGLPEGCTGSFSPDTVSPPQNGDVSSTLTVTTSLLTPSGTHHFAISGSSRALVRSTKLIIVLFAPPDFTISTLHSSLVAFTPPIGTFYPTITSTITVTSINDFSQPVRLSINGLPEGWSGYFNPYIVSPPQNGSARSTFSAMSKSFTPEGTYILTISGSSGALVRSTTITFDVKRR